MPASIKQESASLYRVHVSGMLRKSELENVQVTVSEAILRAGKVRLLFILDRFEGWERSERWGDLDFYVKHDKDIERMAIVGDKKWRDESLLFAGAGLRKAAVEFFTPNQTDSALAWLSEPTVR